METASTTEWSGYKARVGWIYGTCSKWCFYGHGLMKQESVFAKCNERVNAKWMCF